MLNITPEIGLVEFLNKWATKVDVERCNDIARILSNPNTRDAEFTVTEDESVVIIRLMGVYTAPEMEV